MGNRVEDGNRAKNWVVQTFSIRGPVFIFAQRMPPSPSSFLSSALWFLAVSPSSRALFFFFSHPLSSTSFLSATLRKSYFSLSMSRFPFIRGGRWPLTCFFFSSSSFPQKRVLFICVKGNSRQGSLDGLLDGFA